MSSEVEKSLFPTTTVISTELLCHFDRFLSFRPKSRNLLSRTLSVISSEAEKSPRLFSRHAQLDRASYPANLSGGSKYCTTCREKAGFSARWVCEMHHLPRYGGGSAGWTFVRQRARADWAFPFCPGSLAPRRRRIAYTPAPVPPSAAIGVQKRPLVHTDVVF